LLESHAQVGLFGVISQVTMNKVKMLYKKITTAEYANAQKQVKEGTDIASLNLYGLNQSGALVKIKAKSVLECKLDDRDIYKVV